MTRTVPSIAVDLAHRPRLAGMRPLSAPPAAALAEMRTEAAARTTPQRSFDGRSGFSSTFLPGFAVSLPTPTGALAGDITPVGQDASGRLDYEHFSVVMSASRRMAMFVGVNIDGKAAVKINRETDKWSLDGRIPAEAQLGEELYLGNRLDRGHLVRREDPNWGATAETANDDTFHFTNCAPQMDVVNQRTWLGLETYILKNARVWQERCSVFTGPVFGKSDLKYRGALIPKAFWKVIAFLSDDGRPSATAYLVEQDKELRELEAAYGAYKTYQRSIRFIETLTGLRFGDLASYDGFSNEELALGGSVEIRTELKSLDRIRV